MLTIMTDGYLTAFGEAVDRMTAEDLATLVRRCESPNFLALAQMIGHDREDYLVMLSLTEMKHFRKTMAAAMGYDPFTD